MTIQPSPHNHRSKELVEKFKDLVWLNVFAFNFASVFPVCDVSYVQTCILNTVVLPVFLLGLVAITWAKAAGYDEYVVHRREDFYFAFFLCYPTVSPNRSFEVASWLMVVCDPVLQMTEQFIDHFRCRTLSDDLLSLLLLSSMNFC